MYRGFGTWESPRKIELTSLIDVIFLLLIFFLVTMRIIPSSRGAGLREGMYTIRALQPSEQSRAPALIVLKRIQQAAGMATYYVLITSRPGGGHWTQSATWNAIRTANTLANLSMVRANAPFQVDYSPDPALFSNYLNGISEVIITTGSDNGYRFTYGEVNRLIRVFKSPGSMVDKWYISPYSALHYTFGTQGLSFPQLPVRRVF